MTYPQQGYPQPGFYPPASTANPATSAFAAVFGLLVAASLVVVNIDFFNHLGGAGLGDLPGSITTIVMIRFGAAAILLLGAVIVAFRKLPGAIILALGAVAGIAAVLLYPVMLGNALGRTVDFGEYLKLVFKFDGTSSTFSAIALMGSPLVLVLAIIPPTLKWLRGSRADAFAQPGYQQQW